MEERIAVSLSRELTFFDITMIGVAGMIGAGIFALVGIASGIAGPAILLAFLLNGVIATFTGLAYAELGSAIPEAGGGYVWVREAFGELPGFIAGWCDWAAHTIACSLYAVTFGAFLSEVLVNVIATPQHLLAKIAAIAAVSFLTYVNYLGAKESGKLGGFVTMFKVFVLLIFAAFGIHKTLSDPNWMSSFIPFMPNGVSGVLAAMGLTYIAFEGYEIIVQSGEEVKNPEKNIPKAIIVSLWIAVAIYLLVAFALLGSVKAEVPSWIYLGELGEYSLIRVANQIMPYGAAVVIAGGIVSTISAMNATIYSSSRVAFALGRIGYLPRALASINPKTHTPHISILFSYVIIVVMSLAPIEAVASAADVMFLILFGMVNLTLVALRLRRPDLKRSFTAPLVPYLPAVAVTAQIVMGYYLLTELEHGLFVIAVTLLWLLLGALVYFGYSEKERASRVREEVKTIYEELPIVERKYKILAAIANPFYSEKLAKFASIIARQREGEVLFLNVVRLPPQTPLSSAGAYVERAKELLRDVMRIFQPSGGLIKVGHRVADAILNAVEEVKPDLLILGWRGRTFRRDYILGSTIDPVLLKARCDVVVIRASRDFGNIKSILIPTIGGPHAMLAAELARDFAKQEGARIKLFYVGRSEEEKQRADRAFREVERVLADVPHEAEFVVSGSPVRRIAEEVEKHDLTFIGATGEPFLKNFLMGVFPEKVVQKTGRTVAMTRRWVGIKEIIKKV